MKKVVFKEEEHRNHYFLCSYCGYISKEKELFSDSNHSCGKDQCPRCGMENYITCCFVSYEEALNALNKK